MQDVLFHETQDNASRDTVLARAPVAPYNYDPKMHTRLTLALLVLLPLAGCGGSDKPSDRGTAQAAPGAPEQKPPAPAPSPPPDGHAVFALHANRALAHVQRGGGLVVLPGTPGVAKYTRFGRPRAPFVAEPARVDGRAAGFPGTQSTLDVPLSDEQAKAATEIRVRLHSPGPGKLTVFVNQKASPTQALAAGWQTVALAVPAGSLRGGENNLRFQYGGKPQAIAPGRTAVAAVEWIQVGGEPLPGDAEVTWQDAAARAFLLPKGGGIAYYAMVPKGGKLVGDVAGDGCTVKVRARAETGAPVEADWAPGANRALDLSALGGQVVRLEATAAGDACKEARLADAALYAPGPAPKVERPAKPKNVVLWINDSLRRDRMRTYNPKARAETPGYDEFAKLGTTFLASYVQGNESRASHASIWAAVVPAVHGMIKDGKKLDPARFETLPKAMRRAGLFTGGISGNGYITTKMGFGDGWQTYRNNIHDGGGLHAADMVRHAKEWIDKHGSKPFFLYVGTIDTHVSWHARKPWIDQYDGKGYSGPFVKVAPGPTIDKVATGKMKISDRDKDRCRALYDSNVSYGAEQFWEFIKYLEEKKLLEDTMIVMTADHGDEQWEHERVGHGGSSRETLVGVPLMVYYKPLFPAGKRIEEGADTIDILPTILDALGQEPAATAQGESLVPVAQGVGLGYPRPAFSTHYELHWVMRMGPWKIRALGTSELYDLDNDPLETDNIAAKRPNEHRLMIDALATWVAHQKEWKKPRWGVASNHLPAFSDDLEARIK